MQSETIDTIIFTQNYQTQRCQMPQEKEVLKLEQAIEVHGYRGASKMKHNGVVLIKPTDSQLLKSLAKYKILNPIDETGLQHVADVKIVAHLTNGDRGVGVLYRDTNTNLTLHVMGFANYNYKLF